jgi:hypothetical protein
LIGGGVQFPEFALNKSVWSLKAVQHAPTEAFNGSASTGARLAIKSGTGK